SVTPARSSCCRVSRPSRCSKGDSRPASSARGYESANMAPSATATRATCRRVLVELMPRAQNLASKLYGSFEAAGAGLRHYRPDQLALLRDFLEGGRKLYERQTAQLEMTKKSPRATK